MYNTITTTNNHMELLFLFVYSVFCFVLKRGEPSRQVGGGRGPILEEERRRGEGHCYQCTYYCWCMYCLGQICVCTASASCSGGRGGPLAHRRLDGWVAGVVEYRGGPQWAR